MPHKKTSSEQPAKTVKCRNQTGGRNHRIIITGLNYNCYRFTRRDWIRYGTEGIVVLSLIGYLFYRSVLAVILLSPMLYFFYMEKRKDLAKKQQQMLNLEFREGIQALSAALSAGFSVENSFREAYRDLEVLYGRDRLIVREFGFMIHQLEMNETVEKILEDFAARSGLDDVKSFAAVFSTAKRSGGDLVEIIKNTVNRMSDKIEVKREITTMLSEKQLEQRIMNWIPFLIILYVGISSPGFLDILYHNPLGTIIMSVCLFIYGISFYMGKKIVDIEV